MQFRPAVAIVMQLQFITSLVRSAMHACMHARLNFYCHDIAISVVPYDIGIAPILGLIRLIGYGTQVADN